MKRIDLKKIFADPVLRRVLMVRTIIATQAREGIITTETQAAEAYDLVLSQRSNRELDEWLKSAPC